MSAVLQLADRIGADRVAERVRKWTKWGLDPEKVAAGVLADLADDVVAQCPFCELVWHHDAELSWWHQYDRCYLCMRDVVGDFGRVLTDAEMEPFRIDYASGNLLLREPVQLSLGFEAAP